MCVSRLAIVVLLVENLSPIYTQSYDFLNTPMQSPSYGLQQSYTDQLWQNEDQYADPMDVSGLDTNDNYEDQNDVTDTNDVDYLNDYPNDALERENDRISGGHEVGISMYPYHAAYGLKCGGAIIGKKWVLTAAHCPIQNFVRVGSTYWTRAQSVRVKRRYVHPRYSQIIKLNRFDYDIQIVELVKPLRLGKNVQVVKLGRQKDIHTGQMITVTGWGNEKENGPYHNILKAVRIPITSMKTCRKAYSRPTAPVTPRMFCAGYYDKAANACQGDSGGPAVADGRLVGLVSFGKVCGRPGFVVYTNVPSVRAWIAKTTGIRFND